MTKIHFRPHTPNQTVLFPQRIDEDIAENDPVRMVDALVESLNLEGFRKLYKECGRSPYHPKMMLKVILYAYMNNISSFPQLFYPLMTRQFFCDFHEKSEDFCVS